MLLFRYFTISFFLIVHPNERECEFPCKRLLSFSLSLLKFTGFLKNSVQEDRLFRQGHLRIILAVYIELVARVYENRV